MLYQRQCIICCIKQMCGRGGYINSMGISLCSIFITVKMEFFYSTLPVKMERLNLFLSKWSDIVSQFLFLDC